MLDATSMRLHLGGQASGHFPTAPPEPAPDPAKQPSRLEWQSRNTTGFLAGRTRPGRDQQPCRRVPARTTGATILSLTGPVLSESPDEGREIREMDDGDMCGAG
jgi:hypothetical protein